jgi:hypothetical protein
MKVEYILVTPQLANEWLLKNKNNRPISHKHVNSYANEMKDGKWVQQTGEAIKITTSGHIADGQHRLYALIKANVALCFSVFTDLEESVISVLDSGKRRNGSDVLHIYGIKNATTISAIILAAGVLKRGMYGLIIGGRNVESRMTNKEVLGEYNANPEFWNDVANASMRWYGGFSKILTTSTLGGIYVIFESIDKQKASEFMDQLCYGVPVHSGVINLLRNKLIQDMTSIKKMSSMHKTSLIFKAWNCYRVGKDLKILSYNPELEGKIRPI